MPHALRRCRLGFLALPLVVAALGSSPSARAATLTWTGFSGTSWQNTLNWANTETPVSGDSLYFSGSPTTLTSKNQSGHLALTIQDIIFGSGTGNYVITGTAFRLNGGMSSSRLGTSTVQNNIALPDGTNHTFNVGAGSELLLTGNITSHVTTLTKTGAGTLTLTGNNNYSQTIGGNPPAGKTVIQEGTLVMGSQSAIGDVYQPFFAYESVSIGAAGTLNLNGFSVNLRNVDLASTGSVINGNVFANESSSQVNFTLAGSASVSVSGPSVVTLSSSNTYTGTTRLSAGLLVVGNANALGATAAISFTSGTLGFGQSGTWNAAAFTLANTTSKYRVDTMGQTVTLTGNITGPDFVGVQSEFFKSGAGTLVLTGNNSYLDIFRVQSGTVRFSTLNNLVDNAGAIGLYDGAALQWASGSTVDISSRLALQSGTGILDTNGNNVTFATALGGAAGIAKNGAGTLTLSATNTYTGGTVVNGGTLKLNTGGVGGAIRGALTINAGASVESAVTNAFGFLNGIKVDSVAINGGTLNHTAAGDCGWGVAYTLSNGALMSSNGGVSNANAATQFAFGGLSGSNTSVNATSGTSTIAGHVDLRGDNGNTNVNFTVGTGATLNITAGISSHSDAVTLGPVGFTKLGGGTLVLTGSNTYTGTTAVNGGVIAFNNTSALGNGGAIRMNSGTLRWNGNSADLSSRLTLGAGGGTFDTNGNTVTFASAIAGTGEFIKTGSGFLRLTSANSHSGDTTVNGGVLVLAGPTTTRGQLGGLDGSNITINSGNINLETNNAVVGTNPYGDIRLTINTGGLLSTVNNTTILPEVMLDGGVIETAGGGDFVNGNYIFADGLRTAATGKTSSIQGGSVVLPTAVNVWIGDTLRVASVIMGNNNLVKQGRGTLVLTGTNTFTGNTVVNGGLIEFGNVSAFGNAANKITLDGGGLRWAAGNTLDISNRLNPIGFEGATFDTNGNNVTFATALSGTGGLTKTGAGTLRLTTANPGLDGVIVNGGTLAVAHNNAIGNSIVFAQGGTFLVEDNVAFSNEVYFSGGTFSRVMTGNLAGAVDAVSNFAGGKYGTASILAGSLGTTSTLVTSFSTTSTALNDELRKTDVFHFVGTGTATFVLQMTGGVVSPDNMLGWLDGDGEWVNAVDGNIGNNAIAGMQGFDGSYDEFLVAYSGYSLSQTVGAYGYDYLNGAAWAVLNHNSAFAIIPEPGAAALVMLGGLTLFARRRQRK